MGDRQSIVVGVTSDVSLSLVRGFPQYLQSRGWEVHVVSTPGSFLAELDREPGVTAHSLPMNREPNLISDLRSLISWVSLLRCIRPDVIIVGTPKAGLLGSLAARLTKVPRRFYHLRGLRLETTKGFTLRALTVFEWLTMSSAHNVIAVSHSLRQRAIDLRLVKESRIRVLGRGSSNGVVIPVQVPTAEERTAKRQELNLEPNIPVIGFVGRLNVDKGLVVMGIARQILVARGVDHQMLVVGGVDESASPSITETLRTAGRPAVEIGQVEDARPYYAAMDILCLPTLREGFPNVVLEASAAGVPTVTTDATGAIDSVVDGITGRIAAVGDPESLANCLQEMIEAGETVRGVFGARARQWVEDEFSRDDVWSVLEDALK